MRESSACLERSWWPSSQSEEVLGYTLRWRCQEEPSEAELAVMELSAGVFEAYRSVLSSGGLHLGLLYDLHGDVVGLLDEAGQQLERYAYDPYGARELYNANGVLECSTSETQACGSSYGNTRGYAGRLLSAFSGLY
ncbi:MAG: hypothetical protein RBU37_28355, partial [Myxococcota bacterium]|nr:hypothetical protein [Myxococcota bacterium]